jgi:EmrB/QacA subfamily drug resistance transporter
MKSDSNKRSALIVATLSSFITPFTGSSVSVALPAIARHFEMDAVTLSWVSTGYLLTASVFLVPFGRLADIYGRKRIFLWGISAYSLASLFSALSTSTTLVLVFRMFQGFGASMIFGTGVALLTSVYPPSERGKALGINSAAVYLGLSLGPFVGGVLTQHLGWRSVFLSVLPGCLINLYFTLWQLKGEWAGARGEKIDFTGAIIFALSMIATIYGFSLLPTLRGTALVLAGGMGLVVFAQWEMKIENPILNILLFTKNRVFAFSNLASLIHYSATFAFGFLLSLYLQYVKGLSPQSAGVLLICQPAVMALVSPFAGKLSDRMEPRLVASMGMSIVIIGLFLLIFLSRETLLPYIMTTQVLLGVGCAFFASPNTNAVMGSVEKKSYGVAASTLATSRVTGNMFSMGIVTLIFSIYFGRMQITPQQYVLFLKSTKVVFLIFTLLCFGGIFASLSRGKPPAPLAHATDRPTLLPPSDA